MDKFIYQLKDPSNRKIQQLGGEHKVTSPTGLYNQNLTVGELCLLRRLMWDHREWVKTAPYPDDFPSFIHRWLLTDAKELVLYSDIIKDIDEGVSYEPGGGS